jgi:hypothetical protein
VNIEKDRMIWQYWMGPLPPFYELCMETVEKQNPGRVVRLTDEMFSEIRVDHGDVPFEHLEPHHRSDYVRAYCLSRFGGMYIDADCLCVRPLDWFFGLLEGVDFFGYGCNLFGRFQKFESAFCGARAGSVTATWWADECGEVLKKGETLKWGTLGPTMLTRATRRGLTGGDRIIRLPEAIVQPIGYRTLGHLYWEKEGFKEKWDERAFCWMMTHRLVAPYRTESREAILKGETFASWVIRKGLEVDDGPESGDPVAVSDDGYHGRSAAATVVDSGGAESETDGC